MNDETRTFTLTADESALLTLALGLAAGTAMKNDNPPLFRALMRLANRVHEGRPNWTPYEVEPEPEEVKK